jgi:hypothetical protein
MSSLTLVWHVKCMPCQPNDFTQLGVTKDVLINGWHVSKIYEHMFSSNYLIQKSITIYFVYICCNFLERCLFLQVENLNLTINLKNYCFYAMLITCKCMPLYKKLDYDTKALWEKRVFLQLALQLNLSCKGHWQLTVFICHDC